MDRSRGLIPAHAGKTGGVEVDEREDGAHPRSRGENVCADADRRARRGSSPLTRGKPITAARAVEFSGLIPAHAGKTSKTRMARLTWPGSSPLTRGKPFLDLLADGDRGLIPAHAGKTGARAITRRPMKAHPRSRGENRFQARRSGSDRGSSPLTRGKHLLTRQRDVLEGLIPAHAGKTASVRCRPGRVRAHPRSRGENHAAFPPSRATTGSSPLTRGKLDGGRIMKVAHGLIPAHAGKTRGSRTHAPRAGLIPAHAGKTRGPRSRTSRERAHPRSRGEN